LGIISLVLCLLGPLAVPFGIIGLIKSKHAGRTNVPAIIGTIISLTVTVILAITLTLFYTNSQLRTQVCNQDPSNILCKSSGNYNYGTVTRASSFSSGNFSDLVSATSKFFATLTGNSNPDPGTARQTINVTTNGKSIPVTMALFNEQGNFDARGRFSEFSPDGSSLMCITDYQKNVSFMINFDPPNGDGNTAMMYLYDQTNCISSNKSMHGTYGDIKVTTNNVVAGDGDPQAIKTVADGVAQEITNSTMVTNIRAHFIGAFGG
ncbi:MAG: hypothetical protein ACREGB_02340, partial [Candidatus Saccharimonadales bacterium]